MKALIQRVESSKVYINKKQYSSIDVGLLIFLGITHNDNFDIAEKLVNKIIHLRIFSGKEGGMDKSILNINGSVLVVSQFTLYGNCEKGRRPSFKNVAEPHKAEALYLDFIKELRSRNLNVKHGKFGSEMDIYIENSGPVTFMLEL